MNSRQYFSIGSVLSVLLFSMLLSVKTTGLAAVRSATMAPTIVATSSPVASLPSCPILFGPVKFVPVLSSDGQKVAYLDQDGWLNVVDIDGTHLNRLFQSDNNMPGAEEIVWSPDNKKIALTSYHRIISEVPTGPIVQINVINVETSEHYLFFKEGGESSYNRINTFPSWSPDNTQLAFISPFTFNVHLANSNNSNVITLLDKDHNNAPLLALDSITWSPDSKKLTLINHGVNIINADGSGLIHRANWYGVHWAPDGMNYAFISGTSSMPSLSIANITTDQSTDLLTNSFLILPATYNIWSPNSQWIAFLSEGPTGVNEKYGDVHVVDMNRSVRHLTFSKQLALMQTIMWLPDSRHIAFVVLGSSYIVFEADIDTPCEVSP